VVIRIRKASPTGNPQLSETAAHQQGLTPVLALPVHLAKPEMPHGRWTETVDSTEIDRLHRDRPRGNDPADRGSRRRATLTGGGALRVRTAMAVQIREQGRYLGGRPPYGYRLADAGPHPNKAHAAWRRRAHRLEPDPRTAPVVRWIWDGRRGLSS